MGASSSRARPVPSSSQVSRTRRSKLSSLVCGCSPSHAPVEIEDCPNECLVNSAELCDSRVTKFQEPNEEYAVSVGEIQPLLSATGTRFMSTSQETLVEVEGIDVGTKSEENCLFESKEIIPSCRVSGSSNDEFSSDKTSTASSTSFIAQQSSDVVSVSVSSNKDAVGDTNNPVSEGVSEILPEVTHASGSSHERLQDEHCHTEATENQASELARAPSHDSVSPTSDFPWAFNSQGDESHLQMTPSAFEFRLSSGEQGQETEGIIHVGIVNISSSVLSDSRNDTGVWDNRRSGRRLFWDVFSRDSSVGRSDSSRSAFSRDDPDYLEFHERWLDGFRGDLSDNFFEGDSRYLGGRSHRSHHRRRRPRSEIWDRLRYGLSENGGRTALCPSGLHPDGSCSCDSVSVSESSPHSSISRIVMLAEALFEVLDEIHRQPIPLSLSVALPPAPESVVDSFPLKNYKKINDAKEGENAEQCYICLAEYEEGDKIRVLPCHHEYHVTCIDKWLKEIHGICPLCRGDVREGFNECPMSNAEVSSL
ncbi:uncharacterized protein LOC115750953 [Rhodamnia argentea]|uniref:Uncharacterized protein LOC115750953 n=1 Tax=Rhodamnia argentea TaxID=178133 RepID=A0A8B8QBG1_9MYRT|nr:uncharacterized protein LOC115750953 [Rhodamnia argentea]